MRKGLLAILLLITLQFCYGQNQQYDSVKNLIRLAKDDSTRHSTTEKLIWLYIYSYPDSAIPFLQQNILLAQKMKSDYALASSYMQYSSLHQMNGNYTSALQYGLECLTISERLDNYLDVCAAYTNLGEINTIAGDFEQAISNIRKAVSLHESKLGPITGKESNRPAMLYYMASLMSLAQTFERFDKLDSASKYVNKVHDLYIKGVDKWETPDDTTFFSRVLSYVQGNIYSKTGNYSTALNYYRAASALAARDDIKKDIMDNYSGAAITFRKMGQLDSSIFYANKALELSKVANNISVKLDILLLLASVYKSTNNADSVVKYLELTIETKDSLFNTRKVIEMQNMKFDEEIRRREIKEQQLAYRNRFRMYLLLGGLIVVILFAGILYRNNLHKQKAKKKIEKAYADLKSAQVQLIQSEKMASLGELTAGIAHEIQNPLNFVNNFSEVNKELIDEMKSELATGNVQSANEIANTIRDNQDKINQHGKRADAIVKGMLQHSRISSGQKELTDINVLVDEYLQLAYHGLRAKDKTFNAISMAIGIETHFDPAVGKINVVPQEIGRVILNLANNAFYALNEKQRENIAGYEPMVTINTKRTANVVYISVADNGNGIPRNVLDKIFQPFFTTKPTGQGTGLGLSLAYDIIKAHGGEIKAETKEGQGAEFVIILYMKESTLNSSNNEI